MLSIHNFKKSFGTQLILEIPELTLTNGTHWIKGKNGSGKSTFFNCLAGLSPFEGTVALEGHALKKHPIPFKRLVSYSQSEPTFPEFLTGNDILQYFGGLKRAKNDQIVALSTALSVDAYANQPVGNYSSGMLKKLSLVIAFLGDPSWIILDEPLITLDKEAQELIMNLISEKTQTGTSFIFATHQDFENKHIQADFTYEVNHQTISINP